MLSIWDKSELFHCFKHVILELRLGGKSEGMVYKLKSVRKEVMLIEERFLEPNIIKIGRNKKKIQS